MSNPSNFLSLARGNLSPRAQHAAEHRQSVAAHNQDPWILAVRQRASESGIGFGAAQSALAAQLPGQFRAYKLRQGVVA